MRTAATTARHDPRRRELPLPLFPACLAKKASCASAATACCPIASANKCCPWLAHCSPLRGANRCLFHHCLIALHGTVPAAEKPCASSSVSPLHNSTSGASILHDRCCQSAPPACSSHVFPAVCAQLTKQLLGSGQLHPATAASQLAMPSTHRYPSSTTKNQPPESLTESPNAIQYP